MSISKCEPMLLGGIGGAQMNFGDNKGKGQEIKEVADVEGRTIFPLQLPSQWDPSSDEEEWDSDDDIPIMKKRRMSAPKQPIAKKDRIAKVSTVNHHHYLDN